MSNPNVCCAAVAVFFASATFLTAAPAAASAADALVAGGLRCEYLVNPIGVDEPRPRLSWTLASDRRGAKQTAYQIAAASTAAKLDSGDYDLWDSGRVESPEQNQIEYAGKPLASRQGCVWRVRTWDGDTAGAWSKPASWEVGLREPGDWQAEWITPPAEFKDFKIVSATYENFEGTSSKDVTDRVREHLKDGALTVPVNNQELGGDPAPQQRKQLRVRYTLGGEAHDDVQGEGVRLYLPRFIPQVMRRPFKPSKAVTRARLYATALGLYDVRLNGKPVTDTVITPDWTDYNARTRYQAFDVTPLIRSGDNAISAAVADGYFSGRTGNGGYRHWGTRPAVRCQLELTYADGTTERIATDRQWQSHAGPFLGADVMDGERYDARREINASDPALADDGAWKPVDVRTEKLPPEIDAQVAEPVRELMTLPAKSVNESAAGHWVFDIGQNMVGAARLKVNAPAGTVINLRFAEMLNPDGTIYTTNYRGARSTDTYVCRGGGEEVWQPTFTFHGFRYVEVTGLPGKPPLDAITGVVWGSDTPSVGTFACSDERINQLWSNIRWGQRGNFLGVPTDCPQRDERLGWMGDAQVFIGTAVYNADCAAFFTKWLVDVDDAQGNDGAFASTSPGVGSGRKGAPGWGDAGVICPWAIYRTYGDKRQLAQHLPAMMRWVDWCERESTGLIRDKDRGEDFGDWLSIGANTSKELLGTAYFAYSADLVGRSAKVLGDEANAKKYADLFERIKVAFRKKYFADDGSIKDGTQTSYALALAFDLLPEADRPAAAERLAADVKAKGNRLSTGFLGVSYLLPALSRHGQLDTAYRLLFQDQFPSWLFSIKHGATTIWERWDGWTPEKGFQDPGMNSFNHYSLGSCGEWLYESVGGIAQRKDDAGFSHVIVAPLVNDPLTHATTEYDSIRGKVRTTWTVANGQLALDVTVPPNVTATVRVPTSSAESVQESGQPVKQAGGVSSVTSDASSATFAVQSGTYRFTATR